MEPRLAIDIAAPAPQWRKAVPDIAARVERTARAALAAADLPAAETDRIELSVVLGDDATVRALNRRWRGRDAPTNVLSFASGEAPSRGRPLLLGDVVLAYETVAREAAEQGKTLPDHLAHLVAHGTLHLLGYDHETARDAARMEALERRLLAGLGIADPYRVGETARG
ncbi:MAG TPA: rRNA maturation RNase YbeY [Stellaceae bacterium]|nr:rRNA maturation RNase YbeY [Stellaceae bacterium]